MTSSDDRVARALEGIELNTHGMSKDLSDIGKILMETRAILQEGLDAMDKFNPIKGVDDGDS
jgi:hypothetical protein